MSDSDGRPISGARVTLTAPDGTTAGSATTRADGTAAFANLTEGRYSVRARAAGAQRSRSTHIAVRGGLESTVLVTLETDAADTVIVKPKPR